MSPITYKSMLHMLAVLASITTTVQGQTSEGCYASAGSLTSLGTYAYQSEGYCSTQCKASNSAVFAMTGGNECLCGNSLPSGGTVASSLCNLSCSGYPSDTCGGTGYYSVWLSGVGTLEGSSDAAASGSAAASGTATTGTTTSTKQTTSSSSTSTSTTAPTPSVIYITTAVVQQGVTVVQTVSATNGVTSAHPSSSASSSALNSTSSTSSSSSRKSKSSISGGAIAGIVVGVLLLALLGSLLFFFCVRRRRRAHDELYAGEYKRHIEPAGAGAVMTTSGSAGGVDNRLDTTALAIRRNSSESLADNQDYSRKILRVMN